ncbi:RIP metalloprotease RseP [Rhodobacteraceae bacterium WD3A24]|nr:RIP metalloprotease RseP [Rhodobacteraceae bacterium WD3A24]
MDISGFLPSFGSVAFTVAAFIVALSIIVAIHEFGHYIVGRWSGIHAEVFSIGFGPVLFAREDRRGTRWQVAALPFGGYVRFLGDSDAASGKDGVTIAELDAETLRHTMHGAPLWARAATVVAGPLFNFALAIVIFAAVFLVRGVASEAPVIGDLRPLPGESRELAPGDRILAVNGVETPDMAALFRAAEQVPPAPVVDYRVRRGEEEITASGPHPLPPLASAIQPQSAARDADLRAGDVITAIDAEPVHAFEQLRDFVGDSDGQPLLLEVWRDGEMFEVTLVPRRVDLPSPEGGFETRWLIGLSGGLFFEPRTVTPGPVEAVTMAVGQTYMIAETSVSGLYHMITGAISSCNLRGPIGIAETSGAMASDGLGSFIWFIAVLSTAIGLLNLFPIPVLDGGHLVFHAWEAVTGRPPSDRALRTLMALGLALIGTLMVFALTNDIFCP